MHESRTPSSSYYLGGLLSPVRTRKSPNSLYVSTQSAYNFKKSDSIGSSYSPTYSSGLRRMQSKANDSASKISDFYNKDQINEAISALDGVSSRINAIDFILKRRVELKEVENQYKISKAAPVILRLNKNFQKRILKNKLNTKGNAFKKILSRLNEDGSLLDPPPQALKHEESVIPSKTVLNRSQISLDTSVNTALPKINIHKDSISDSVSKNTKPPTLNQIDDKTPAHIKDAQMLHKARHLTFLLGKAKVASPKALVFGDGNQDSIETWEQVVVNSKSPVRHAEEEQPKGLRASGRKKSLDPRVYHLGQKYLENDLYKYLVKNGQRGDGTRVILNEESEPKEKRMKDIEAKVKSKYTKLVKDKVRNSTFFASPSRTNVSSQENLNSKIFEKELLLHQGLSPTSGGAANNKNRRFTSFVTVRKLDVEQEPSHDEERLNKKSPEI